MLPGRSPRARRRPHVPRRTALGGAAAGRLYAHAAARPTCARRARRTLPLFGYTFACVVDDELHGRRDARPTKARIGSRAASPKASSKRDRRRTASRLDPRNRTLAQLSVCAREYGCFTAQNVFLERGEAAIPVAPKLQRGLRRLHLRARRRTRDPLAADAHRVRAGRRGARAHRRAPSRARRRRHRLVRSGLRGRTAVARRPRSRAAIERIRAERANGTINLNTNGSLPKSLQRLIDAGLQAVRISLNSFRPRRLRRVLPARPGTRSTTCSRASRSRLLRGCACRSTC